jgi:long-chain fatty acid transport protein
MNRFATHRLVNILCAMGLISISTAAQAGAFQIWEQDSVSVGNFHAGYAAEANDASTAWYNPAGIPRIKNQQLIVGVSAIQTRMRYTGNVGVTENSLVLEPAPDIAPVTVNFDSVSAQGGLFNAVPHVQYVAPISDWIGFGFSVDIPFGLKTDYGRSSPLQYVATITSLKVVDITPSLGVQMTDKAYVGVGFDIQRAYAEFNSVGAFIDPDPFTLPRTLDVDMDTESTNKANDTGYGFRLGFLYELTPCTRFGITYHSQVVHHLSGSSKFVGPIADLVNNEMPIVSSRAVANIKLPPYTALSYFSKVTPQWAFMGTFIYTQWNTFQNLSLNQAAGVVDGIPLVVPDTNINVNIPQHYRNAWNVSVGANYYYSDNILIRAGAGFDQSPVLNAYRTVQVPDNDRWALAIGGHWQASKTIGFDAGWTHVFFAGSAHINPPPQVMGGETVTTSGHVNGSADVVSAQVVWDIL